MININKTTISITKVTAIIAPTNWLKVSGPSGVTSFLTLGIISKTLDKLSTDPAEL